MNDAYHSLKRYHANTAARRNGECRVVIDELEDVLASPETVENRMEAKELTQYIRKFLNTLSEENRVIFMRRYWFIDPYASIAGRVGLTGKTVSGWLVRIRKQLKE